MPSAKYTNITPIIAKLHVNFARKIDLVICDSEILNKNEFINRFPFSCLPSCRDIHTDREVFVMSVTVSKQVQLIPTYIPKAPNDLPMFFENKPYQGASGRLYPLPYSDGISDQKTDVRYEVYSLENEYIKTEILPQIGGKILRAYDKKEKYDFFYHNEVIKPALVGLAGAWISGGIEFNFPQHHRPTTFMPAEADVEKNDDGSITVWVGEVEPFYRMRGMAGITVEPGKSYIKARVRIYNRTPQQQRFMWWANMAFPANHNTRTVFPPDVEWVNDHDRRTVIGWPVARGIYKTARPFNYGDGTDLSRYDSVVVPSSFLVSQGQSDMDFISGYDEGVQKGVVSVSNHYISPGKKMWTWGHGDFGAMWCSNLTDNNGPYIELMTGVYTDNQPDFTWIAPYETKEFEQYWYPIHDIGIVKNATVDAAINFEKRKDAVYIGINVTGKYPSSHIYIEDKEHRRIFEDTADLSPEASYERHISFDDIYKTTDNSFEELTAFLTDQEGHVLVDYKPYVRGSKKPIEPRKPVLRPSEIPTVEELYINGYHLEQYKQHNYQSKDYYLEGLRRDPGDIRCNTSMSRLALKNGEFEECITYADKAIERLTLRNEHPTDTEALYLKGVALFYLQKYKKAYDTLYRAAWNYTHRSAAHYIMALIDCQEKKFESALSHLDISYGLNKGHVQALNLRAAILRKMGKEDEAINLLHSVQLIDRLDLWSRYELQFNHETAEIHEIFDKKPENYLDVVCDYMNAGFYDEALSVLDDMNMSYPLFDYYRAYILSRLEKEFIPSLRTAAEAETGTCFPSRLMDIFVLQFAIANNKADANAYYYLGCLYYDRFRYDDAVACWEKCIAANPKHAKALRNLGLAYFDKKGDAKSARICLEKALEYKHDPRLLFEYQQLLKNSNTPVDERLDVYEKYSDLLDKRDDCYLDEIVIYCMKHEYARAIDMAKHRHFHIYEGGEGKLTKQHSWMYVLYANQKLQEGDQEAAEKLYKDGFVIPKSYGEAKTYFNQEAHLCYYLGLLQEEQGRKEDAVHSFEEGAVDKSTVSELSMFRALCLQKLNRFTEAEAVLKEMLAVGKDKIRNCDRRSYYGVGSPCPMPFEYDIRKENTVSGHILSAYAYLGLGDVVQADEEISAAAAADPYNFLIYAFHQVKKTL